MPIHAARKCVSKFDLNELLKILAKDFGRVTSRDSSRNLRREFFVKNLYERRQRFAFANNQWSVLITLFSSRLESCARSVNETLWNQRLIGCRNLLTLSSCRVVKCAHLSSWDSLLLKDRTERFNLSMVESVAKSVAKSVAESVAESVVECTLNQCWFSSAKHQQVVPTKNNRQHWVNRITWWALIGCLSKTVCVQQPIKVGWFCSKWFIGNQRLSYMV